LEEGWNFCFRKRRERRERIRGNLMGKRVGFSGRVVITGDQTILMEEVLRKLIKALEDVVT
jgi:DNA-directed RNA polymerase beta' subunit